MAQARKTDAGAKGQAGKRTRVGRKGQGAKKVSTRAARVDRNPAGRAGTLSKTTTIPQNKLRNESGDVLRRAERGEHFIVTVNGRPAAELGPLPGARKPAPAEALHDLLTNRPPDASWLNDLLDMRAEDEAASTDPFD